MVVRKVSHHRLCFSKKHGKLTYIISVGFAGQARVILPTISACYECGLNLHAPRQTYPICTIQSTPRLPEHCIAWAFELEWPRVFGQKKLDKDDPDHISWLYDVALRRAQHFNIEGVTWSLTQGVVKNIVSGSRSPFTQLDAMLIGLSGVDPSNRIYKRYRVSCHL